MEMQRACDDDEYRRWRGELRCHYLCLLPFVNGKNVMRLYRKIYHGSKSYGKVDRKDGIYHIVAPSVLGVIICAVCLCSASWAWFSASRSNGVATVQAAVYRVKVEIENTDDGTVVSATSDQNGIYSVSLASGEYSVSFTANGTAENGYCKIELCGTTRYTPQIRKGSGSSSFGLSVTEDGVLTITPQWGTCSAGDESRLGTSHNSFGMSMSNRPSTPDVPSDVQVDQPSTGTTPLLPSNSAGSEECETNSTDEVTTPSEETASPHDIPCDTPSDTTLPSDSDTEPCEDTDESEAASTVKTDATDVTDDTAY